MGSFILSYLLHKLLTVLSYDICSAVSNIKPIQKRGLRFLYNDHNSNYAVLLSKANKPAMEIKRLLKMATEIFKTINNVSPSYMKDLLSIQ